MLVFDGDAGLEVLVLAPIGVMGHRIAGFRARGSDILQENIAQADDPGGGGAKRAMVPSMAVGPGWY